MAAVDPIARSKETVISFLPFPPPGVLCVPDESGGSGSRPRLISTTVCGISASRWHDLHLQNESRRQPACYILVLHTFRGPRTRAACSQWRFRLQRRRRAVPLRFPDQHCGIGDSRDHGLDSLAAWIRNPTGNHDGEISGAKSLTRPSYLITSCANAQILVQHSRRYHGSMYALPRPLFNLCTVPCHCGILCG